MPRPVASPNLSNNAGYRDQHTLYFSWTLQERDVVCIAYLDRTRLLPHQLLTTPVKADTTLTHYQYRVNRDAIEYSRDFADCAQEPNTA
jgi:hypothetical protein